MKTRQLFIFAIALLIFHSCIVKSLYPFYTKDTISFDKRFLGIWQDKDPNIEWIIASMKDLYEVANVDLSGLSFEEVELYNTLKEGYFVMKMGEDEQVAAFFAMPFKVNNQLFLYFTPLFGNHNSDRLVSLHEFSTHSLVKFDIKNDNSISSKWFSSEKIESLFENHKINIKHEKHGSKYLLTASPEELQKFIAKYLVSNDPDKWKTGVAGDLKRIGSSEKAYKIIKEMVGGEPWALSGLDFDFNY